MAVPSYGRLADGDNTPTEILASVDGMEKLGCMLLAEVAAVAASITTACVAAESNLKWTAAESGVIGNHLELTYSVSGSGTPEAIAVADGVIDVTVGTDASGAPDSTGAVIMALAAADSDITALATVALKSGDDGTGIVDAEAQTNFSGGSDEGTGEHVKGTVMGIVTATGLWAPYDDSAGDGTEVAKGILADTYDIQATQADLRHQAVVYIHGSFVEANLTGLDANGKTDLAGRSVGSVFTF